MRGGVLQAIILRNKEELVRDVTFRGEKVELRLLREQKKAKSRTSVSRLWPAEEPAWQNPTGYDTEEKRREVFDGQGSPLQTPE